MKKISKKDIRTILETAIYRSLLVMEISGSSKKINRAVKKASKELSGYVKEEMKSRTNSRKKTKTKMKDVATTSGQTMNQSAPTK